MQFSATDAPQLTTTRNKFIANQFKGKYPELQWKILILYRFVETIEYLHIQQTPNPCKLMGIALVR